MKDISLLPPLFEELWAPFEVHRFYMPKEGKNNQGLGYTLGATRFKKPKFTRVSKAPRYSCNIIVVVIRDSSNSKTKLLQSPQKGNKVPQNPRTIEVVVAAVDEGEVTEAAPAPK